MNHLTQYLQPYLLQSVEFVLNDKVIKRGKIKIFNFKQYFVKFSLETDSGELKVYDLMYPFRVDKDADGNCVFNYHLSAFSGGDLDMFFSMKAISKDSALPAYDGAITLKSLSSPV
jgi:hypothetical protein